jgi:hypothetical protein
MAEKFIVDVPGLLKQQGITIVGKARPTEIQQQTTSDVFGSAFGMSAADLEAAGAKMPPPPAPDQELYAIKYNNPETGEEETATMDIKGFVAETMKNEGVTLPQSQLELQYSSPENPVRSEMAFGDQFLFAAADSPQKKQEVLQVLYGKENVKRNSKGQLLFKAEGNWQNAEANLLAEIGADGEVIAGGATGALAGSAFGPIGTAVGAGIGAAAGKLGQLMYREDVGLITEQDAVDMTKAAGYEFLLNAVPGMAMASRTVRTLGAKGGAKLLGAMGKQVSKVASAESKAALAGAGEFFTGIPKDDWQIFFENPKGVQKFLDRAHAWEVAKSARGDTAVDLAERRFLKPQGKTRADLIEGSEETRLFQKQVQEIVDADFSINPLKKDAARAYLETAEAAKRNQNRLLKQAKAEVKDLQDRVRVDADSFDGYMSSVFYENGLLDDLGRFQTPTGLRQAEARKLQKIWDKIQTQVKSKHGLSHTDISGHVDEIDALLELGRKAPSAGFNQKGKAKLMNIRDMLDKMADSSLEAVANSPEDIARLTKFRDTKVTYSSYRQLVDSKGASLRKDNIDRLTKRIFGEVDNAERADLLEFARFANSSKNPQVQKSLDTILNIKSALSVGGVIPQESTAFTRLSRLTLGSPKLVGRPLGRMINRLEKTGHALKSMSTLTEGQKRALMENPRLINLFTNSVAESVRLQERMEEELVPSIGGGR